MLARRLAALGALSVLVLATATAGLYSPVEDALMSPAASWTVEGGAEAACAGGLLVGVAAVDVSPGVKQPDGSYALWMEPYEDANGNGVYDAPDPVSGDMEADPFTDENANGKWDGPFMAGYGHEKAGNEYYVASSVHDPVWARALAFTCGDVTLGMVSVDTVGLFRGVVTGIREAASDEYDHVVVASTHTHDSIDTMGLWGPSLLIDGKDPRTMAHYQAGILEALAKALETREAAAGVQLGSGVTRDLIPVVGTIQTDLRDPFVIDDRVSAARFVRADGSTIATIVNWSPHPETMAGTKSEISADYAHYLREAIETDGATVGGVTAEPVGGTAVFFVGAVGGMMTTLGARPLREDGSAIPDYTYEKVERIGDVAAFVALRSLAAAPIMPADGLRVQTREASFPSDNPFLMALNAIGVLDHEVYAGPVALNPIGPTGIVPLVPILRAEVDVLTLTSGGADLLQALTFPGEVLPEVALGNPLRHDAEATLAACYAFNPDKLLFNGGREGKVNPATGAREPGFERKVASRPAYGKEPPVARMATAPHVMMLGLANDEMGYIVPADDFVEATFFPEVYSDGRDRCGDSDHYEETNSAGSLMAPTIANAMAELLDPSWAARASANEQAGFLGEDGDATPVPGWDTRGVWIDSSRSGGYESQEDAHVRVNVPAGMPGCWGFLNGHRQDMGQEPGDETRGFWIDVDADCRPGDADGLLFADMWAMSEGQPYWRP